MLEFVMQYISLLVVPLGILVSGLGIYTSYRAQVQSGLGCTMLSLLMACSCLAAAFSTGKVYMQLDGFWRTGSQCNPYIFYVAPHDLGRSIISSATAVVFLYKVVVRMSNNSLEPKQGLLACFGVLAAVKIILIVITPQLENKESEVGELKSLFITSVIECTETVCEVVCLVCLAVHAMCCKPEELDDIQPINQPTETQEVPPILLLLFSRTSIFIHLILRLITVTSMKQVVQVPMNSLIFTHSIVFPIALVMCVPCLKSALKRLVSSDQQPLLDLEMEETFAPDVPPDSAPTRPSSVPLPQLLPGIPEIKRISYQSNIRSDILYSFFSSKKSLRIPSILPILFILL